LNRRQKTEKTVAARLVTLQYNELRQER